MSSRVVIFAQLSLTLLSNFVFNYNYGTTKRHL
jgi:hypothetical protein